MTVQQIRDYGRDTLVCSIPAGSIAGGASIIEDLDAAVDIIMSAGDRYDGFFYRAIDLSGTWTPEQGAFDPWGDPSIAAWTRILDEASLHDPLLEWLDRVERIAARYLEEKLEGLHESEESQLGEVPATLLALRSPGLVPIYTRFLKAWDLDHGVYHGLNCIDIVKKHGITPETEDLLFTIGTLTKDTLVILRLRDILDAHYGDFATSDLARAW